MPEKLLQVSQGYGLGSISSRENLQRFLQRMNMYLHLTIPVILNNNKSESSAAHGNPIAHRTLWSSLCVVLIGRHWHLSPKYDIQTNETRKKVLKEASKNSLCCFILDMAHQQFTTITNQWQIPISSSVSTFTFHCNFLCFVLAANYCRTMLDTSGPDKPSDIGLPVPICCPALSAPTGAECSPEEHTACEGASTEWEGQVEVRTMRRVAPGINCGTAESVVTSTDNSKNIHRCECG